jgi:predicted phage terminase large subunit-like protein
MSGTLSSRKVDKAVTPVITIMQRLHEDDVSGFLLSKKKKGVKHICLPARLSESVSPSVLANNYINGLLDPNRLSEDILTESKADLGSLQFAGQFQQEPAPMDGYLIKAEWFPLFRPTAELISLPRYFDSDTAYGKEQSDNSATICYSVKDGTIYVWNVWLAKLPFNEFIPAYKDHLDLFRYTEESKIYIEPKASGTDIIQVLSSEGLNVKASESPKDNKMTRLQAALPKIETGHVKLLANQSWIEPFLAELMQFPVGKNDDQVDVLSSIVRRHLIQQSKWTYISN